MLGTDLKPKKKSLAFKVFFWTLAFAGIFLLIFYLYGFLWQKFGSQITKSITQGAYIETTGVACTSNNDCISACTYRQLIAGAKECLCLGGMCSYVDSQGNFSESRYCDVDSDCTISCYEGPISNSYYQSVGGELRDCSDGCKTMIPDSVTGSSAVVCKNHQCEYRSGQTCYISSMKR